MGLFDEFQANSKLGLVTGAADMWNVETCPCGVPPIDHMLGGGAAYGRMMEMFGNEASGKTLLLYKFFIENTRRGGTSILFEAEGAYNPDFYKLLGGDPSKLLVYPVKSVEKVFDQVREFCKLKQKSKNSNEKIIIGWDSLAATGTEHLLETGMDVVDMSKPRILSQAYTLIATDLMKTNICFIIINQLRAKIDKHNPGVLTPGGMATGFAMSQRLSLHYSGANEYKILDIPESASDDEKKKTKDFQQIGRKVECLSVKNKVAGAWLKCTLYFYSHAGFPHPKFEGCKTTVGLDVEESLFDYYFASTFRLPNGDPVITSSSPGWYQLSSYLDPAQSKFRKKEWPDLLAVRPELLELLYQDVAPDEPSAVQAAPPGPPK